MVSPLKTVSAKIEDNIAICTNPKYATGEKLISEAARLGGADSVTKRLWDVRDTYSSRPDSVIRIQHDDENGSVGHALREQMEHNRHNGSAADKSKESPCESVKQAP